MNPLKNLNVTTRWLTVVFASVLFASVGVVTYNAFADNAGSETDNRQQHWSEYHHNYNMSKFAGEKEGDDHNDIDYSATSNATSSSCGPSESIVNYVGTGATNSTLVKHKLGVLPRVMYILDLTNPPGGNVDGITTIISTKGIVYVESGNDYYAPIPIQNVNVVNSTTVDVGNIYNQTTQILSNAVSVNTAGTNYEMIALNFGGTCNGTSHSTGGDDDRGEGDDEHDHEQDHG